jgi:hypothetical protein
MKIHPCELSIAKDAAQPDRDEGLLMASLAAILWLMSDHGAHLRWKGQFGANPNPAIAVDIPYGRKPQYPEKTQKFR